MPSEAVDPFDNSGGITRVKVGPNFSGKSVGQPEPGGGQSIRSPAQSFGQGQIFDGPSEVVSVATTSCPCDQVLSESPAELNCVMMFGHIRSA